MSYILALNEEDRKIHEFIMNRIDKKEINNKNFRKYLNLDYIKIKMKNEYYDICEN